MQRKRAKMQLTLSAMEREVMESERQAGGKEEGRGEGGTAALEEEIQVNPTPYITYPSIQ